MSGALPWIGSYSACRRPAASGAPSVAEGSIPRLPVSIEARSDSRSPNRLLVTITSNWRGLRTSCMAQLSAYMCDSSTSAILALVQRGDHLAPEQAALHHVGLLDAA